LVATILSAQSTDKTVNKLTPAVFARYPRPADLAAAAPEELERLIYASGFFRTKTKSLIGMAQALEEHFGGEVPERIEDLVMLPGVGRKTANVVRSVAMDLPGLPVDTHVKRVTRRLELTTEQDPVKIEADLNELIPADQRGAFSLRVILHGRQVCFARRPACDACVLEDLCPSSTLPSRRATTGGRAATSGSAAAGRRQPRASPAARSSRAKAADNVRSTS
jgi:endonuclease-3